MSINLIHKLFRIMSIFTLLSVKHIYRYCNKLLLTVLHTVIYCRMFILYLIERVLK